MNTILHRFAHYSYQNRCGMANEGVWLVFTCQILPDILLLVRISLLVCPDWYSGSLLQSYFQGQPGGQPRDISFICWLAVIRKLSLSLDVLVYVAASISKLGKTTIGNTILLLHPILAPVFLTNLVSQGLSSSNSSQVLPIVIAVAETLSWVLHLLFSCQQPFSKSFQLNRYLQLARVCYYLVACVLASISTVPIQQIILVLSAAMASSIYTFFKLSQFEYADIHLDYMMFVLSLATALGYWLTLIELATLGLTTIRPLIGAVIAVTILHRLGTLELQFIEKYKLIAEDPECSKQPLKPLHAAVMLAILSNKPPSFELPHLLSLRNWCLEVVPRQTSLLDDLEKGTITDAPILQFLVEWLLQQGDTIKAFVFFHRFVPSKTHPTLEFIRLELDHHCSMPIADEYCRRVTRSDKYNTKFVADLLKEESTLR